MKRKAKILIVSMFLVGLVFISTNANATPTIRTSACGSPVSCVEKFNSTNVLGYWKFNENSGLNASDSSGNENHGQVAYANWTTGKLNNGLGSNGINQSVRCGNIDYSGSYSIEFWTYIRDNITRTCYIDDWDNTPQLQGILMISLFSVIAMYTYDMYGGTNYHYMTMLQINTHRWYHLCVVYNASNPANSMWYKNGEPAKYGEFFTGTPKNFTNDHEFQIMNSTLYSSFYKAPKGVMDNVIFYNTTLTANEVKSQYNKGNGYEGYPDADNPYWSNLNITPSLLEFGLNATVEVDVCDISGIREVLIEYGGINHSMTNVYNNTWSNLGLWKPTLTNYRFFRLFFTDNRNNTCWIKRSIFVVSTPILFMSFATLGMLMIGMIFLYLKFRVFLIVLTVYLFSIVLGISSFFVALFPFTPYLQIGFLVFQTGIFFKTSQDMVKFNKRLI